MTNPCELLARLNPASARLDGGGRGGIPELTPQDIAAALGMVRDTFAREVFCAVWWPDGAKLVWRDLSRLIGSMQFGRWRELVDELVDAQIAKEIARREVGAARVRAVRAAEGMIQKATRDLWPPLIEESYARVRAGAMAELRAPRTCRICNGRGQTVMGALVVSCERCNSLGRVSIPDAERADMLGFCEDNWLIFRPVYEWTFKLLSDKEAAGRELVRARIEEDEA